MEAPIWRKLPLAQNSHLTVVVLQNGLFVLKVFTSLNAIISIDEQAGVDLGSPLSAGTGWQPVRSARSLCPTR